MKNRKKLWIIIIILILLGIILATTGIVTGTKKGMYMDNTGIHMIEGKINEEKQLNLGEITGINLNVDYFKIIFEEAENYGIEIRSYDDDNKIEWKVENGILKVEEKAKSKFSIVSFDLRFLDEERTSYIKIYYTKDIPLNHIVINTKDSNIKLSKVNAKELKIENKYGRVELEKLNIDTIQVTMKDGRFDANDIKSNQMIINDEYGRVTFNEINSAIIQSESKDGKLELSKVTTEKMNLKSKYGKIIGKQLETVNSDIESRDGSIELEGDFIGKTQIRSTYGKINITTKKEKAYYNLDFSTKYGKITIDGEKMGENKEHKENKESEKDLRIIANDGSIYANFNK